MTANASAVNVAMAVQVVPFEEYCAGPLESATNTRCTPSKLEVNTATFSTATPDPKSLATVQEASLARRSTYRPCAQYSTPPSSKNVLTPVVASTEPGVSRLT